MAIGLSFGACVEGDDDNDIDNDIDNDSDNDSDSNAKVTGVSISPDTVVVIKGKFHTFTAKVTGDKNVAQTVVWSISESGKEEGTSIDDTGKLTVADNESLKLITVKAVSTEDAEKSATASVSIIPDFTLEQPINDITATELVAGMKIGWNLGNTFDAGYPTWFTNPTVIQIETSWLGGTQYATKKSNFDTLKTAGFNAVRIPVSWNKVVDEEYNIRADWMARVTEVVNYAVANDMYILLNTHHDEDIFKFSNADVAASLIAFNKIWGQIADNFKNYDEKLVFEALNEPRIKGGQNEWNGGTPEARNNLNTHYQNFIQTVRESGGNNGKRILMVNTFGASAGDNAVNGLVIPTDTVENKIIVSVHAYTPYNFALNTNLNYSSWSSSNSSDKSEITNNLDRVKTKFIDNGYPVIMGEFGAMTKNNEEARAAWAQFYVSEAMNRGIPCFWWDNHAFVTSNTEPKSEGFGFLKRDTNEFAFPNLLEALMEGAGVR